jgi:hypothetical protein
MGKTTKLLAMGGALFIAALALIWLWFRSHTSDVHLKYVPQEAAAVFSIHTMEIASKIDLSKIDELKPASQTVNDIPDFLMNIMTDPVATGIDPVQNFYGFVEKEKQSTVSALVVAVDDEGDFTSFAEKMFPGRTAEDLGSFNYLDIDDTRGLAWNGDAAVFVAINGGDIRAYTEKLFANTKDESIQKDTSFTAFNAKAFDAGLWTNNERLTVLNDETSPLSLIGMAEGHSQFFVRFEQNEIVTEYIAPKQSEGSIFQLKGPEASDLTLLGTKDPLLFISLNFDVKQLLASAAGDPAMQQNVDMMTGSLGLTNEEMAQLFTGSVVAAVSDYKDIYATDPRVQKETMSMLGPLPAGDLMADMMTDAMSIEVPVTTISLGITDETKANNMMLGLGMKPQDGGFWAAPGVELVIYVVVKSNHLVITNDYVTAESIAKNGALSGKLPADYAAKVPMQSFGLYMDFEKTHMPPLLLAPQNPLLDQADIAGYVALSGLLSSVQFESTANGSKFRMRLPESEENSIMRVIRFMQPGK